MCRSSFELEEVASLPNNIYAQHIIHLNQLLEQLIQLLVHKFKIFRVTSYITIS